MLHFYCMEGTDWKETFYQWWLSHRVNMFYLWSRNCHEVLYVQEGQIHQNINVVLNFWTNYHLSLTQSQDQNYSNMILNEMLLKKLLTKHYRNIAYQQFRQTLNETDCNFLGQIFQAQTKALLTYAPLG